MAGFCPDVYRVAYLTGQGLRATKFVPASSPDAAVSQVAEAAKVLAVRYCPEIRISTKGRKP